MRIETIKKNLWMDKTNDHNKNKTKYRPIKNTVEVKAQKIQRSFQCKKKTMTTRSNDDDG